MEMQEASIEVTVVLMNLKTEETRRVQRGPYTLQIPTNVDKVYKLAMHVHGSNTWTE